MSEAEALSRQEANALFAPLVGASHVLVALSGGADSTALLLLLSAWARDNFTHLSAATVDHGLRPCSALEADAAARFARSIGVDHRILRWEGAKPQSRIEAAARTARYGLLEDAARESGASHLVTAHTLDDQAETVLMRLAAGSGPAGLAGMRREMVRPSGLVHLRPLLSVPKARLVSTLRARGIGWAEDEMNADPAFARPRLRSARQVLEAEGLTNTRLGVFAQRMERMLDAIEHAVDEAWQAHVEISAERTIIAADAFFCLPEEIALRVLMRAVGRYAADVPERLARAETLCSTVREAVSAQNSLVRTLAGAKISVGKGHVRVEAAPPRRHG